MLHSTLRAAAEHGDQSRCILAQLQLNLHNLGMGKSTPPLEIELLFTYGEQRLRMITGEFA
jgi:hypothetical protein